MYPLLLYGLSFLFGIIFKPLYLFPISFLFYFATYKRAFLCTMILFTGYFWFQLGHSHPPEGIWKGSGHLVIQSISLKNQYGKPRYFYKGLLTDFKSSEATYKNIPIFFTLAEKGPVADGDFFVEGILFSQPRGYSFKPNLEVGWKKVKGSYNFSEKRFYIKEKLKSWVKQRISQPASASLLSGLVTGDFDDKSLLMDFSQLGLSHLLAISGFHFTLIAAILGYFIKPFLSVKKRSIVLLLVLGIYCAFLGVAPSIMRAFITLFIFLLCPLLESASKGENSLGACLIVLLIIDPFSALSAGFILSFLATAAILIFFPLIDNKIKGGFPSYLPTRSPQQLQELSKYQRGVVVLLTFIRSSVSLNIAVLIVALPATLAIFHSFPPFSFIYNLFFPLLLSISILLFILSIPLPFLHSLNSNYTYFILQITRETPAELTWVYQSKAFTPDIAVIVLTLIFSIAIYKKRQLKYT